MDCSTRDQPRAVGRPAGRRIALSRSDVAGNIVAILLPSTHPLSRRGAAGSASGTIGRSDGTVVRACGAIRRSDGTVIRACGAIGRSDG